MFFDKTEFGTMIQNDTVIRKPKSMDGQNYIYMPAAIKKFLDFMQKENTDQFVDFAMGQRKIDMGVKFATPLI